MLHDLYEFVRQQMQNYFPMTPLPRDKIIGLFLMATWSTGPTVSSLTRETE